MSLFDGVGAFSPVVAVVALRRKMNLVLLIFLCALAAFATHLVGLS